jgi:hypothetical protein
MPEEKLLFKGARRQIGRFGEGYRCTLWGDDPLPRGSSLGFIIEHFESSLSRKPDLVGALPCRHK